VNQPPYGPTLTWGIDAQYSQLRYIPAGVPAIWPYVTGTTGICWPDDAINGFNGARITRVNQGYDSPGPFHGDEFDFERGAWTLDQIVSAAIERARYHWSTRIYATYDGYGQAKAALARAGLGRSVFYRIADWDLSEHLASLAAYGDVYGGQWASPTSNPDTVIPGTHISLATANVDLNVVLLENTGWQG
jgi:hypothetical protein